ncbi:RNA-BINDING PROTEIN [Salix purpurea]|uniref:Large ribosomal subunit protein bL28c n=1 Tax=Salix purpurea TaxID=77065 RepID=A0A9Q0Z2Y0_SALPP|nr:RNA-BINDING PROTEIN [Salix purpurea]
MNEDMRTEVKEKANEKIHDRRKRDKRPGNFSESEAVKKHSREVEKDRHVGKSRGKSERERKEKYRNGIDDKSRDRNAAKKHDLGKGHHLEASERRERKESSKSHNEEIRLKRTRSRSREHEDRNRRSISLSPRAHKHGSYHKREHAELSSPYVKERSGRQQFDAENSKPTNSSSSRHHRRHGGSASGLGGYSPRKRKSEAAVKTPSPAKRSPEKKNAKWDLAPEGKNNVFPAVILSNFESQNQTASSNIHEVVSAVPVVSAPMKPLSEVSPGALSTAMKVCTESIKLTQASHPMKRLYIENIPASASEKAVMDRLNNFLISSGVKHIQGTQPCISCIMQKEKGRALVEFLTPEDASAALSFDGCSFSGSIIKVRWPKDSIEVTTGELEKSTAAIASIGDIVKDSPHKIFIGGISKVLSSKMLMEIASAFGPLKAYQFENSKDPDEPIAFLEYAEESVTLKACAGLNGMKLGGQVITAIQAVPNASSSISQHAKALLEKPTEVLKLKNVFDSENLSTLSNMEVEEVLEDVRLECARFGSVKSINVVKYAAITASTSKSCEFSDDTVSAEATQSLGCDGTNPITRNIRESIDQKFMEGDSIGDDKPASDVMEDEPCQPGQVDSDVAVQDLACKNLSDSQDPPRDELDSNVDKVTDDIEIEEVHVENKSTAREDLNLKEVGDSKLMAGEGLNLEEVSGDVEKDFVNDSMEIKPNSIEKGDCKEQDCNLGLIFERGCVFVEFRRTEASCMAAHCLHGRCHELRATSMQANEGIFCSCAARNQSQGLTLLIDVMLCDLGGTSSLQPRERQVTKEICGGRSAVFFNGPMRGHVLGLCSPARVCSFLFSKTSQVSVSEIGFVTSQLSGIRISYNPPKPLSAPFSPALQPVIARRICPFTGKKANRANKVSFSNHKTKKLQFVNLQYKRVWWEAGKRYVKLRLSTKALKTIEKNGLDAVAKKAGIDLRKK